jgi:hypothetical protein
MMDILKVALAVLGVALLVVVVTLAVIYRRLRHTHVAADAGFFETLRRVPLSQQGLESNSTRWR